MCSGTKAPKHQFSIAFHYMYMLEISSDCCQWNQADGYLEQLDKLDNVEKVHVNYFQCSARLWFKLRPTGA